MRTCIIYLLTLWLCGCTKTVYVPKPVERRVETVITERDTITQIRVETEHVTVVTPDTMAEAKTRYATANASVSGGALTLSIRNNDDTLINVKAKTIIKTIVDSVPYPVEVHIPIEVIKHPWYLKILSLIGLCAIGAFGLKRLVKL